MYTLNENPIVNSVSLSSDIYIYYIYIYIQYTCIYYMRVIINNLLLQMIQ